MDGIDGIAGLQALIAGLGWFSFSLAYDFLQSGADILGLFGLLIAASSLGFLLHNRPPARIFMGDVGSAFLGYSFAIAPLLLIDPDVIGHPEKPENVGFVLLFWPAVLLVWPFLFDTVFTFMRRALKRENVFKAHRSHLFQRLVIAGCSHLFVTLLYAVLALEGAFFALLWAEARPTLAYKAWMPLVVSMFGIWAFTRWREILAQRRASQSLETQI
jgi:UDP-N-acetylmuramyl pentapeptide phosphotransferase/UDP-N-acetylglucosamine-1-phosphate transferase